MVLGDLVLLSPAIVSPWGKLEDDDEMGVHGPVLRLLTDAGWVGSTGWGTVRWAEKKVKMAS